MRPIKIVLIVLVGLACGVGLILAYNTVHNMSVLPGANILAPGPVFTDTVAVPDRLIIPKIGVDAHVKSVGVDANGDMATPGNPTDVAWYNKGPHPGMTGSAVIDGHLNTRYVKEAVFYHLRDLAAGDEMQVRTVDGQELTFKVTRVQEYAEDAPAEEIFNAKGNVPYLNLITCSGDWDPVKKVYNNRIVVFTERVR
jgi:LPXTG-site transpeptidase (sortase) family protein